MQLWFARGNEVNIRERDQSPGKRSLFQWQLGPRNWQLTFMLPCFQGVPETRRNL